MLNLLSSSLLSKNLNIKMYRTIILPVVYGRETWSPTLREEHRLRVCENSVLRRILGPKGDKGTGEWKNLHNEVHNDPYSLPNIVQVIKSRRVRWAGHRHAWVRGETHAGFWWGNLRDRDHLGDPCIDGRIILR